jgi:hypothetical protein
METNISNPTSPHGGRTMAGVIILVIGSLLLINQLNLFFIPNWLFSWPMWIIAYGVYMGGKYNFRKPVWLWLVVMGTAFLFTENIAGSDRIVWPVAIIGTGLWMVMKHTRQPDAEYSENTYKQI